MALGAYSFYIIIMYLMYLFEQFVFRHFDNMLCSTVI